VWLCSSISCTLAAAAKLPSSERPVLEVRASLPDWSPLRGNCSSVKGAENTSSAFSASGRPGRAARLASQRSCAAPCRADPLQLGERYRWCALRLALAYIDKTERMNRHQA
jgi:hypothetical protein